MIGVIKKTLEYCCDRSNIYVFFFTVVSKRKAPAVQVDKSSKRKAKMEKKKPRKTQTNPRGHLVPSLFSFLFLFL